MKLMEFIKGTKPLEWVIGIGAAVIVIVALVAWVGHIRSSLNEARINELETEKQQLLKQVDEAVKRDLIKAGEIKAKDEQIKVLTSQIAESNAQVDNAHNETQTARNSYEKVRRDPPKFNSADDAGRIRELQSGLRELYPDSPR